MYTVHLDTLGIIHNSTCIETWGLETEKAGLFL